jgi:NADH-quinone oxidoreductase subunit K
VTTILTKRSALGILIGVELILNAAAINFVAFNRFSWPGTASAPEHDGLVFAVFVIVLAAAEAAVALSIILNFYNTSGSVDVDRAQRMRG